MSHQIMPSCTNQFQSIISWHSVFNIQQSSADVVTQLATVCYISVFSVVRHLFWLVLLCFSGKHFVAWHDFSVHLVLWARTHPELFCNISGTNIRTMHAHALWNQGVTERQTVFYRWCFSWKTCQNSFTSSSSTYLNTRARGCTHALLRPRGCNQGNVLANLLCNSNPKGGWVMMHYNNYTPTEHTHTRCLRCSVVVHNDTETLKRNRDVSQFHLQHISSVG